MLLTTSVGSLPKPEYLTKARAQVRRGEINAKQLRALEEQATREWSCKTRESPAQDDTLSRVCGMDPPLHIGLSGVCRAVAARVA